MSRWSGMPRSATDVFRYIIDNLQPNHDTIYLWEKDIVPDHLTRTSFYRGKSWLSENDFIAPHEKPNVYFINPTVFFNGDRLALVNVWEKASAAEIREKAQEAKQLAMDFEKNANNWKEDDWNPDTLK